MQFRGIFVLLYSQCTCSADVVLEKRVEVLAPISFSGSSHFRIEELGCHGCCPCTLRSRQALQYFECFAFALMRLFPWRLMIDCIESIDILFELQ